MLAVHCWMHTLQKMCLQGRARTVSTMWSRQMGHRSSRASTGQTHALRLGLGAASWLMAAAALALWGSKDGFGAPRMMDSLEAASCGAVGSLCASTRKSLARLLCLTHWQGLSVSCSHRKTLTPRESPARLNAGWARWLFVGSRRTVRSRADCDSAMPSPSAHIGGALLSGCRGVPIVGIGLPESTQGLSMGHFHKR